MAADAFNRKQKIYILAADVAEFNRRFASDEFAGSVSNLSVVRSIKPKKYCWKLDTLRRRAGAATVFFGIF